MFQRLLAICVPLTFLLCVLSSQAGAEEKTMKGLSEKELGKVFKELSEKWHPTKIKGYAEGKESRYDITWESGNPGYYFYFGVSAGQLAKFKKEHAKEGYKTTVESTWKLDGEDIYAAIFRKK